MELCGPLNQPYLGTGEKIKENILILSLSKPHNKQMSCKEQNITRILTVIGLGYYSGKTFRKNFVFLHQKNNQ